MCLNKDIEDHIKTIVSTVSGMDSIWLIGSRANGTATENSDWDLLIFGPANIHKTIKNYPELRRKDIDLLVF